jgi:hypothetical protein
LWIDEQIAGALAIVGVIAAKYMITAPRVQNV